MDCSGLWQPGQSQAFLWISNLRSFAVARFRERVLPSLGVGPEFNVIKLRPDELKVSFLAYPGFFEEAHPAGPAFQAREAANALPTRQARGSRGDHGEDRFPGAPGYANTGRKPACSK